MKKSKHKFQISRNKQLSSLKKIWFIIFLLFLFGSCTALFANTVYLNMENDSLNIKHDDSDYTHGTEILFLFDKPLKIFDNKTTVFDNYGFSVQQNMYTPDNIDRTEIDRNDRPYCGLFLFSAVGVKQNFLDISNFTVEQRISVGCVGENSFSRETQTMIHKLLDVRKPSGWENQIENEFIIQSQTYLEKTYLLYLDDEIEENLSFTISPYSNIMLGNFKISTSVGLDLKFNLLETARNINLPDKTTDNHTVSNFMFSSDLDHLLQIENAKRKRLGISFLVGVESRYVFHDTSLEGSIFESNNSIHTVDIEPLVSEIHYGVEVCYRKFILDFILINRTKEYKTQDEPPDFGRISLGYNW